MGLARESAEACTNAVSAGHDEAAGAAGQALALAALQQPARRQEFRKRILLVNGIKAIDDDALADNVTRADDLVSVLL